MQDACATRRSRAVFFDKEDFDAFDIFDNKRLL